MKYICTGRVHPERADVSFSRVELRFDGGKAVASCDSSQITVALESDSIDGWIVAQIWATDVAALVIGALGFALGCGYSVEIMQVTEDDGTPHVFGVQPRGSDTNSTLGFEAHMPGFNRAIQLSMRDVFFRLALRDYLRAITAVTDCATYCYRSIEGIKSAFVFKSGVDRWDEMHAALGTDRQTITRTVKDYADAVRHGNWVAARPTNKHERWAMLALTRNILVKYMDYSESAA